MVYQPLPGYSQPLWMLSLTCTQCWCIYHWFHWSFEIARSLCVCVCVCVCVSKWRGQILVHRYYYYYWLLLFWCTDNGLPPVKMECWHYRHITVVVVTCLSPHNVSGRDSVKVSLASCSPILESLLLHSGEDVPVLNVSGQDQFGASIFWYMNCCVNGMQLPLLLAKEKWNAD